MDRPDKISLKDAAAEANRGTVKQRCAAQRKRLRAKYSMALKLTERDRAILREGVRHPDGVMRPSRTSNFDRIEKRMAKLVKAGLATPSPFNDWYITPAGRDAVRHHPI